MRGEGVVALLGVTDAVLAFRIRDLVPLCHHLGGGAPVRGGGRQEDRQVGNVEDVQAKAVQANMNPTIPLVPDHVRGLSPHPDATIATEMRMKGWMSTDLLLSPAN